MAIVVESTSTATGSAPNVTITKPTGLAVGDLMVAILSAHGTGTSSSQSWNTASGWTSAIGANYNSRVAMSIQYKYADSGDVAASNFTFSLTGSTFATIRGSILRCTGSVPSGFNPIGTTDSEDSNVAGTTLSGSLSSYTPSNDGALIIMQVGGYGALGPYSISSYNTTTTGITFSELFDVSSGSSATAVISAAYGIQNTAASLTAYTASFNASTTNQYAQFAVVIPPVDATGTNTLVTTTSTTFTQTGTADTTGTTVLAETTAETFPQTGKGTSPTQWTNEPAATTTWTNET